jgi:P-type E1-E2 ATPase
VRTIDIPGEGTMTLEHVVLDVNGTLTNRGELLDGVAERLAAISADMRIHVATADTFGAADDLAARLGIPMTRIGTGADKERLVARLGAERTAAIGNGRNDAAMLRAARLGIAVIGPEGAAAAAVLAADVVCGDIRDALDLLLDDRVLRATFRT